MSRYSYFILFQFIIEHDDILILGLRNLFLITNCLIHDVVQVVTQNNLKVGFWSEIIEASHYYTDNTL